MASSTSAQDVGAAARAYQAGQAAYLQENFSGAAEYFEMAFQLAPNSTSLRSAARARLAAGHYSSAAQLADELLAEYDEDAGSVALAEAILDEVEPRLGRVALHCDAPCVATIDGQAQLGAEDDADHIIYARPGTHAIAVSFGDGAVVEHEVVLRRRAEVELNVARPPMVTPDEVVEDEPPALSEPTAEPSSGLTPTWFIAAAMATVVAGGFTIWSGTDVLSAHDRFLEMPTQDGLDDGRSRELRTNILIGVTSTLALTTFVLAFLTDWSGEEEASPVSVEVSPNGASAVLQGTF
ncbi:MAG: hypothetical protein AAGF12_16995 [Myxococcota bacterium]